MAISAVISLAILFFCWQDVSAAKALFRGYLFGLGLFGTGTWWVYISIHDYGGGGLLGSSLLTGLFVGFLALFPAITGWLSVKLSCRNKSVQLLTTALLWVLLEYVRGALLLNGFPWLISGYSQLDTPLAGYMPLIGAYGSSFLMALTAAALVYLAGNKPQRVLIVLALAALWAGGGLAKSILWTAPAGQAIQITMVQGNVRQDQKWLPENRAKTLETYQSLTQAHWDSQVIIWPESAIPAYLDEVAAHYLQPLHLSALQHHTDLIISVPSQDLSQDKKYNAVITLGNRVSAYRKNHLLPFGEYLPLQPVSGFILNLIKLRLGVFEPGGNQQPLLHAAGYDFATSICYEDAFGAKLPVNAAFLVNVTNDAWFGDSAEPHQHLQMARMRALETGRYLLRSTNTGITAIIAPDGKIRQQAPQFTTTTLTGMMVPMTGSTPYAQLGDPPIILTLALCYLSIVLFQFSSCRR